MPGSTFGQIFRISTFGESHGPAVGVVVDGCPAGLAIDTAFIQAELDRRRPGQSHITTQRKELDEVEILSGIFEGISTGAPIAMMIRNEDAKPKDYSHLQDKFRPSHADYTYEEKYGLRDHRGGGRSSARETAARVAAGAIAKLLLKHSGIEVHAYVSAVADIKVSKHYTELDLSLTEQSIVRCPDEATATAMIELIERTRKAGDSVGGIVTAIVSGCPAGLGEPVFDKLHADLAKAQMSIPAVKGFEYGSGFSGTLLKGSEHNDIFDIQKGHIVTRTNYSGGIQGGISNGMDIYFHVAFKPVATIMHDQESVDSHGDHTTVQGRGRHDPCVLPRAVPIVEAMAALVVADHLLRGRSARL